MRTLYKKIKVIGIVKLLQAKYLEGKAKIYRHIFGSYSQAQEDLVIDRLLGKKKRGFYVDIGASDGLRYSNTHYFYQKGWRGINIEPDPDNFSALVHVRQGDVNVPLGIGKKRAILSLLQFFPGVLSTFSKKVFNEFIDTGYEYKGVKQAKVDTLVHVLDTYAKENVIDFFSIDTEGYDFIVLQSNNWKKYKPALICIESEKKHEYEGKRGDDQIYSYLTHLGYRLVFDNGINRIYQV